MGEALTALSRYQLTQLWHCRPSEVEAEAVTDQLTALAVHRIVQAAEAWHRSKQPAG